MNTAFPDVEHVFRHAYARIVATLAHRYSPQHIELIEDAVQEALIRALQTWPFGETPDNPSGWLYRVANNLLLDQLRRAARTVELEGQLAAEGAEAPEFGADDQEDEQLRMIFACCHPSLKLEDQLMLSLKLLGGLNVREIAGALFKQPEAIKKALTRAKRKFREKIGHLEIPSGEGLLPRLQAVMKVIFLIFNEGYKAAEGDTLVRQDLCGEALRLALMLRRKPVLNIPELNALIALMCFHAARIDARQDQNGLLVQLKDQDRSLWNPTYIDQGRAYLNASLNGYAYTEYHMMAIIAAHYTTAPTYADTEWKAILFVYDRLLQVNPSPVVALNRTVVLEKVEGAQAALEALDQLAGNATILKNHLYYAIRADIVDRMGQRTEAKRLLEVGKSLTENKVEQKFYQSKIDAIQEKQ